MNKNWNRKYKEYNYKCSYRKYKLSVSFSYLNVFIEYLRFYVFNTLPHIIFSKDLFSPDEERTPENTEIKQAGSHVSVLCLNVSKEKQNKVLV